MNGISEQAVRIELERILSSKTFQHKRRLQRFLNFVVSETVKGRGEELKEFAVGMHVFGKESSFDPRNDPIVRVQAGRLRASLVRYYREEGSSDPIWIDLPKGHYFAVFRLQETGDSKPPPHAPPAGTGTVIVLPFSDCSPQGELGYLGQGIQQEIIHAIVSLGTVRVVMRSDSCLEDCGKQAIAPGERVSAIIVCGSVRKFGNRLRINCQLIDATSGVCLSSDSIDRGFSRLFGIQEEIAQSVLRKLRAEAGKDIPAAIVNFKGLPAKYPENFLRSVAAEARISDNLNRPLPRRHNAGVVALGQVRGS